MSAEQARKAAAGYVEPRIAPSCATCTHIGGRRERPKCELGEFAVYARGVCPSWTLRGAGELIAEARREQLLGLLSFHAA